MWQPNTRQWPILWATALLLILAWPPGDQPSLGVRVVNWLADPLGSLPELPDALPMGLDDDGDAVTAHDALETEYYRVYNSSAMARARLDLKTAGDPFNGATERQLLIGIAVIGLLVAWKLSPSDR